MKASQCGVAESRVLDHFARVYTWAGYLQAKYEGWFPVNMPTRKDIKEISDTINYHRSHGDPDGFVPTLQADRARLIKAIKVVQKEWSKLQ